jgi:hypothetical protein
MSASVRVADPPPKKTSTAGRMAESQCLPQAHNFFRNAKVRRGQRSGMGCTARAAHPCCCSNWPGCFWNGRGHTLFCTHRQSQCLEGEGSSLGTDCIFREIRCLSCHWLQRWEFQHQEQGGVEEQEEWRRRGSQDPAPPATICGGLGRHRSSFYNASFNARAAFMTPHSISATPIETSFWKFAPTKKKGRHRTPWG